MRLSIRHAMPLAAVAVLQLAAAADAVDIITRKDAARRLGGNVTKVTKTEVSITETGKPKPTVVPVNEIERITWTGQPATLDGYLNAEAAGRTDNALDGYQKLLKAGSLSERVKSDLEYFVARVSGKIALADSTKLAAAISGLESYQSKNSDSRHYYEGQALLADLYLAAKSYDKALTTLADLKKAPWKEVTIAAENMEARVLLAQGKAEEALKRYESVLAGVGADAKMRPMRDQAMLGKAACLTASKKHDDALKVLKDVVASAQISESAVLAEAYLLRGDNHLALGNSKDALFAYLHVDVLFAKEKKFHPRALYHLAQLWKQAGHPTRAVKAQNDLDTLYKNWKP